MTVPLIFLVFGDLGSFDECWLSVLWTIPLFGVVLCFSHVLMAGEEDHRRKVTISSQQGYMLSAYLCCDADLDHVAEVGFVRFLSFRGLLLHPLVLVTQRLGARTQGFPQGLSFVQIILFYFPFLL